MKSYDWSKLETVLLDMDGTLLDLAFDNYFWLELIPREYAKKHQLTQPQATRFLKDLYHNHYGTLNWYCTDFWSEQMQLDVVAIKSQVAEKVEYRTGTLEFLKQAKADNKKLYLVTNAHPDTLRIKLERKDFSPYFDELLSSHDTGYPKENMKFWNFIKKRWCFNSASTLFVDDSPTILQTAKSFGIGAVYGVSHPDSSKAPIEHRDFPLVNRLTELLEYSR
ncbi:GMP/IMP nucleotidase [Kangiella sp. TOML190]|uniref:GMP/IMP nucleotidase n=1 Tax=Kangiella sp. TOML190 TaxID=2931351 RepID=UPI00203FDBFC|nr:GMP/IMP nucleotidase [Kangiella sp. TOML190]